MLTACATSPELSTFPDRAIDRKGVLSKGLNSWNPIVGAGLGAELHSFDYLLEWEQGMTDRLTVVWMPLPLEFKYLLKDSETLGSRWWRLNVALLGPMASRDRGFDWRPTLGIFTQSHLNSECAIQSELILEGEVRRTVTRMLSGTLVLKQGLLFQANSWLAISPWLSLQLEYGAPCARYVGATPSDQPLDSATQNLVRLRSPLYFDVQFQLHRQWELRINTEWYVLGYVPADLGGSGYVSAAYVW